MLEQATDRGLVRASNEDAVATRVLAGGGALLVVADGIGGYPGGDVASRIAVDAVVDRLGADDGADITDPAAALHETCADADRRVRAAQAGARARMGTTLVVALVRAGAAWIANVGDSRAYVASPAGGLRRVTRDHSWVEEEMAAGRLAPDDPLVAVRRHIITRALGGAGATGDAAATRADVFPAIPLPPGARLLLCTDGLHGVVPDAEIAATLAAGAAGAARRLVDAALAHGGPDNVTVAVYAPAADPGGGSPV